MDSQRVTLGSFAMAVRERESLVRLRVAEMRALAESGAAFAGNLDDARSMLRSVADGLGDIDAEMRRWRWPDAWRP